MTASFQLIIRKYSVACESYQCNLKPLIVRLNLHYVPYSFFFANQCLSIISPLSCTSRYP